jgi:predicted transposase YdaD
LIKAVNFTEEERKMVTLEEKAIATYDAEMYYAYAKGEAEGKAEGEARGKAKGKAEGKTEGEVEMIFRMLSRGHTPEAVADFTGIPLARIEQVIINNN